jgi:hypothetical protein
LTSIEKSGGLVIGGGEYDSISVSGGLVCRGSLKVLSLEVSGGVTIGGDLVVKEIADVSGGIKVSGIGRCGTLEISGGGRFKELICNIIDMSGGLNTGRIQCGILGLSGGLNSGDVRAIRRIDISGKVQAHGNLESEDIDIHFSSASEVTGDVIGTDIDIKPNPAQQNVGTVISNSRVASNVVIGGSSVINMSAGPYGTCIVGDIRVQGLGDKIILSIAGKKHVLPPKNLLINAVNDLVDVQIEGEHYRFTRTGEQIRGPGSHQVPSESKTSPWRFRCKNIKGRRNVELTNVTAELVTGRDINTSEGCNISKIERL